jgi:hypothetical protein
VFIILETENCKDFYHNKNRTKQRIEEKRDVVIGKETKNELDYICFGINIST